MTSPTFEPWPKTPRLFREVVITEKIDGSNAAVGFNENGEPWAQSRKRLITPLDDNFGFARWVSDNRDTLFADLGPGLHFGEWWGSGIQRGYGQKEKFFSLFNVKRFDGVEFATPNLRVVPVLDRPGVFDTSDVEGWVRNLAKYGSCIPEAMGFEAEGVCVFHTQSRQVYKVLCENDDVSKTEALLAG